MRGRVVLDRDVNIVRELSDGVVLAGRVRLRPGYPVDLLRLSNAGFVVFRRVLVCSWSVVSLGSSGPMYCGTCQWE